MAPLRVLAAGALLAAACGQSPFDRHPDDPAATDGGGGADASADAGPVDRCPEPCTGSLGAEGSDWPARADLRELNGLASAALVEATIDGAPAFARDEAGAAPAVIFCDGHATGVCAEAAGRVVLVTTPVDAEGGDPAVVFTLPSAGRYRISGAAQAIGAGDAPMRVLLSRRSRAAILAVAQPTSTEVPLEATLDAVAGDRLVVTVQPVEAGTPHAVALRVHVTELEDPLAPTCQLALDFEPSARLVDGCGGKTFVEQDTEAQGSYVAGPTEDFGEAQQGAYGAWQRADGYVDYGADSFTFETWARFEGPPTAGNATIYGDDQCLPVSDTQGGLALYHTGDQVVVSFSYDGPSVADQCEGLPQPQVDVGEPTDLLWHHYRFVRDRGRGEVYLCVDGVEVDAAPMASTDSMTSGFPPTLGRDADFGPARWEDQVDDLRIVKRALPCLR